MRVGAEKTVESFEPAAQRPAVVGSSPRHLCGGRQMPLAQGIRVVAMLKQHLRQEPVLERDVTVAAGIAGGAFRNARQGVGVVVAASYDARARRRTERRRMHVVEEQSVFGQIVYVRRFNGASVTAHLTEPRVVLNDEKDVGHPFPGTQGLRPGRLGYIKRASNHSGERRPGFVLFECHG